MLQRFATWRCTVGAVTLEVGDTEVSTATLLAVLRQLSDTLQPHGTAPLVDLLGRQWTDNSFLQALAATPTLLPQYKVSLHSDAVLTDESLSALLAMGDRVHSVSVDSLSLQSDQHSNTAWPGWDWLRVSKLDATQLLRLPRPVGVGARGSLSVSSLHLPHDLTQVSCLWKRSPCTARTCTYACNPWGASDNNLRCTCLRYVPYTSAPVQLLLGLNKVQFCLPERVDVAVCVLMRWYCVCVCVCVCVSLCA